MVIKPQYRGEVGRGFFSEGLAAVRKSSGFNYGYIDKEGNIVIEPEFNFAGDFINGLARIKMGEKEGGWGYINKEGKRVIPARYDFALQYSEGLAAVKIGEQYGYIDLSGKRVIQPQYDFAGSFSEDLAPVRIEDYFGYIDKKGEIILDPEEYKFKNAFPFNNGVAQVWDEENRVGYINKLGQWVWPPTN
jgi:hypothetical protein